MHPYPLSVILIYVSPMQLFVEQYDQNENSGLNHLMLLLLDHFDLSYNLLIWSLVSLGHPLQLFHQA